LASCCRAAASNSSTTVGGVLVEALLEFSHLLVKFLKALLVPLHKR
jgi:hypothetical protein